MEQKQLRKENKKRETPLQCKNKCECTPTTSEATKLSEKNCLKPENDDPSVSRRDETRLSTVEKDEPFKNLNETGDKYPDKYEHISSPLLTEPEFSEYKSTQLEAVPITTRNSTPVNTFNNSSSQNVAEVIGQTNSNVIRERENDFRLW
ncbi:hypothetical protein WA026_009786 [Henosepilachna vigintioctopunctata]|uniref:Uncharacterized protein n=1 Tax=Henosepilachna vigintioctopunctata TaxID=420089 RepID=A0AAW1TUJ6_9CUCU